ncbi:MAG: HAD family hydrolase [Bacteroidia bacterium]
MKIDTTHFLHFSFDLWLTLIKSNPLFKPKRDKLFKDFFSIECSLEKVSKTIRMFDEVCNKINEKTGMHVETNQIYYLILNELGVDIYNVDMIKLEEFYLESEVLFMNYKPLLIYPSIDTLFKELISQGKSISILSNTAFIKGKTLRKLLAYYQLEAFFSFQLYSDEIGYAKPSSTVFNQLIEQATSVNHNKLSKLDIVHIGDNKRADYEAAINMGIQSILINN